MWEVIETRMDATGLKAGWRDPLELDRAYKAIADMTDRRVKSRFDLPREEVPASSMF